MASESYQVNLRYRLKRIEAGLCVNAGSHGPATRGQRCEACAEKDCARSRAEHAKILEGEQARDFWAALEDLYHAGRIF